MKKMTGKSPCCVPLSKLVPLGVTQIESDPGTRNPGGDWEGQYSLYIALRRTHTALIMSLAVCSKAHSAATRQFLYEIKEEH